MLETIKQFMDGKKTYTGVAFAFLGMLGVAGFFGTEQEFALLVDAVMQLGGLLLAVYGRYKVNRK